MGSDEPAAVGDGGAEVGNLQRRGQHLALADGHGDDGVAAPVALGVEFVVELGVGQEAALLAGQVETQLVAVAHAHEMVFPHLEGLGRAAVLAAAVNHVLESPAEEGVARCLQRGLQRQWRAVGVAAHAQAAVDVAMVAGIGGVEIDDALLQQDEALRGLESGAGRICCHVGAVVERPRLVVDELAVVLAALAAYEQARVVGGRRHHAQNLARRRLYGHHGASLAHHERLGILLELDVEAETQVAAAYGRHVARAVLVAALDAAAGVADENLHALVAAQIRLVAFLHAEVAGIVAGRIIVVALHIVGVHLADVAEHVGGGGVVVLAQDALLYEESREAVELLLQAAVVLRRQLRDELLRRVRRIAGVEAFVAHVGEALAQLLGGDVERGAEVERVEGLHVAGNEHDVVGRLVEHHELAVAVVDEAARRIHRLFQKRVAVGALLVAAVVDLQVEQAHKIYERYQGYETAYYVFSLFEIIVFSHGGSGLRGLRKRR